MAESGRDYMTIGEVVEHMSDSYPDLTISKVRFLEDEGLVSPERTGGGYRKFHPADVTRIELVLRLQRDHFMPLALRGAQGERQGRVPPNSSHRSRTPRRSRFRRMKPRRTRLSRTDALWSSHDVHPRTGASVLVVLSQGDHGEEIAGSDIAIATRAGIYARSG